MVLLLSAFRVNVLSLFKLFMARSILPFNREFIIDWILSVMNRHSPDSRREGSQQKKPKQTHSFIVDLECHFQLFSVFYLAHDKIKAEIWK